MASLEEIRSERLKKLELLKASGMKPFAVSTRKNITLHGVKESFEALLSEEKEFVVAGRVMSIRDSGAIAFVDLFDGSTRFQVFF